MYNPSHCQPDYPAALASLQHMDIDTLKEILNEESKFDTFVKELPQIKSLEAEKDMLMTSNKSLAEYNISQEPLVKEQKERLLDKFQSATALAEKVKALKAEIDNKSGKMTPDSLLVLLEAANQVSEEDSEKMVEQFMSDGGSLDEFLEEYKDIRRVAHLRRIKIDKMRELLASKQNTPARPAPPPPGKINTSHHLPYPVPSHPSAGYHLSSDVSSALPSAVSYPAYPPVAYPGLPTPGQSTYHHSPFS